MLIKDKNYTIIYLNSCRKTFYGSQDTLLRFPMKNEGNFLNPKKRHIKRSTPKIIPNGERLMIFS